MNSKPINLPDFRPRRHARAFDDVIEGGQLAPVNDLM
jgi:hypothetical protein